jgi:hypothetical protein
MRNLLITTIGDYNHSANWEAGEKNYDVVLIDYRKEPTFKYPGIYKHLKLNAELLNHDYFWMPDEDVNLSSEDINRLFDLMSCHKLDLAQPSIERSLLSFPSFECFAHKENIDIVYINFIEITCPCFSKRALMACLDTFRKSQSGWGLDIVWPKLVGDNSSNIAVLNSIVAQHTRPVKGGGLYTALAKKGIRPGRERVRLMNEYRIPKLDINIHD